MCNNRSRCRASLIRVRRSKGSKKHKTFHFQSRLIVAANHSTSSAINSGSASARYRLDSDTERTAPRRLAPPRAASHRAASHRTALISRWRTI
ncbi:hypothetical protein B5X24_HaOG204534 [Helicoverpa armigera]|uniref:Uncharacterized protein n=1 Tax=Helicoverpa armigera TaxID=29058 RepID=A0A2W1BN32_HELAM|nr:hypothetical protein B5X24_HaOG204534 [Helicoverpa armigera]